MNLFLEVARKTAGPDPCLLALCRRPNTAAGLDAKGLFIVVSSDLSELRGTVDREKLRCLGRSMFNVNGARYSEIISRDNTFIAHQPFGFVWMESDQVTAT